MSARSWSLKRESFETAKTESGKITGARDDPNHPANFGRLCTKEASLHLLTTKQNRLLYAEVRLEKRQRTPWQAALGHAADKFAAIIKEHGPDAVAFYISGQLLTEDYYVFNEATLSSRVYQ